MKQYGGHRKRKMQSGRHGRHLLEDQLVASPSSYEVKVCKAAEEVANTS